MYFFKQTNKRRKQASRNPTQQHVGWSNSCVSELPCDQTQLAVFMEAWQHWWLNCYWVISRKYLRWEAGGTGNLGSLLSAVRFFWLFLPQRKDFAGGVNFFLKVLDESLCFVLVKDIRKLLWLCSHPSFPCSEPWMQWPRSPQHLPREHWGCCRLWPWDGQGEICLLAAFAIAAPAIKGGSILKLLFHVSPVRLQRQNGSWTEWGFLHSSFSWITGVEPWQTRRLSCLGVHRLALLFATQKHNECLRLYVVIWAGLKFPARVVSLNYPSKISGNCRFSSLRGCLKIVTCKVAGGQIYVFSSHAPFLFHCPLASSFSEIALI